MQRRPRGVSQAFRDEEIHGEYEEAKDEDDDEDELPRSTSFMANNLTRTLLAASERNPTSYMSKAMSTQGRAAKTFAKEFNPEPSKKQYNKARGLGKTANVVTTQLTSIFNSLKGKDGLATSKLGDAIHALDLKYDSKQRDGSGIGVAVAESSFPDKPGHVRFYHTTRDG